MEPPSAPGRVVYGYLTGSGDPYEADPASCFVAGMSGSGKSNSAAVLLRQIGGRVYLVDGHAGGPGSLAELLRQPAAAHDQAGAVAAVAEAHAELLRRVESARTGRESRWEPWTVALDEFDRLAKPPGPDVDRMLSNLLEIAGQGRKFGVFVLIGTQNVAGPLSVVPAALRSACGLIVHQVGGQYVPYATGERTAALPANPVRFAPGEALVKLPGRPEFAHVRFPLAPVDGAPLSAPPPPAIDVRHQEREQRRDLARARGKALGWITKARARVGDVAGDEADAIRGELHEAEKIAKRARSVRELQDELAPYWATIQKEPADLAAPRGELPDALAGDRRELRAAIFRLRADACAVPGFDGQQRARVLAALDALDARAERAASSAELDAIYEAGEAIVDELGEADRAPEPARSRPPLYVVGSGPRVAPAHVTPASRGLGAAVHGRRYELTEYVDPRGSGDRPRGWRRLLGLG